MEQGADEPGKFGKWTEHIIGAAIEVHAQLGPGLLENIYEECLCYELRLRGITFDRQVYLPVFYKEVQMEIVYRLDLVVENEVVVELKAVDRLLAIHEAQVITYLKLTGLNTGLLLNFNVPALKVGIRRLTRKTYPNSPASRLPVKSP
jgi:GxxExxY protein